VVIEVADVGWMSAFTNAAVVQLLEVDIAHTAFKFYATAAGSIDIELVFAHKETLQTATTTVHVEVIDDDAENVEKLSGLSI
jgi:hypothetical protein